MYVAINWMGIILFLLPLILNIPYLLVKKYDEEDIVVSKALDTLEGLLRTIMMLAMTVIVSEWMGELFYLVPAVLCLWLYAWCWRKVWKKPEEKELLFASFHFVPYPLAVFPVLYFIFCSFYLGNYIAVIAAFLFGVVHFTNTSRKDKKLKAGFNPYEKH